LLGRGAVDTHFVAKFDSRRWYYIVTFAFHIYIIQ